MKLLIFYALLALIYSCGRAPTMPESHQEKSSEPLTGKSDNEILKLKYNHQIYLECALYVQAKQVGQFQWDVVRESSMLRFLNYEIGDKNMIVAVRLSRQLTFMESQTHIDELENEYYMEHSPLLDISFRRASKRILRDGSIHDRETFSERTLYENIESNLLTIVTDDKTEELRCKLKTLTNAPYRHQWRRVK